MSHYQHLSIEERESIWEKQIKGESVRRIAAELGWSASTISRELKRNQCKQGYRPSEAQKQYHHRREQCRRRRLLAQQQWSPEQISERMAMEHGKRIVSYSTIYRALKDGYMEPKGTRKNRHGRYPMQKYLRRKGWRGVKKLRKTAAFVHQTIEQRPKAADRRSQFGHFEGDLVYSSFHKLYVVTLVDRRSRYLMTGICQSRKPEEVARVIASMLDTLPKGKLRSITPGHFTQGKASLHYPGSGIGVCPSCQHYKNNSKRNLLFCPSACPLGTRYKRKYQWVAATIHSKGHL